MNYYKWEDVECALLDNLLLLKDEQVVSDMDVYAEGKEGIEIAKENGYLDSEILVVKDNQLVLLSIQEKYTNNHVGTQKS